MKRCGCFIAELFLARLRGCPRLAEDVGDSKRLKKPGDLITVPDEEAIAPTGTQSPPI